MRVLFIGTAEIAISSLSFLLEQHQVVGIITQPDRKAGRGHQFTAPPIKMFCKKKKLNVPIFQPDSPNSLEIINAITALFPSVILTMAYGHSLSKSLLEIAPYGCFNVHTSLLPKYRGASPIQATIAQREIETGITIMQMVEKIDAGDILIQKRLCIRRRETFGTLAHRLSLIAPLALQEALERIETGNFSLIPQKIEQSKMTKKIYRIDTIINWNLNAYDIEAFIRSLQPKPSAISKIFIPQFKDQFIKIHSGIIDRKHHGTVGTILRIDKRGILVACGKNALLLNKVQLEGKRIVHSSTLIKIFYLNIGDKIFE